MEKGRGREGERRGRKGGEGRKRKGEKKVKYFT